MHRYAYRMHIEVLDYVFYATTQVGRVYRTGPFIGNYALMYALFREHYWRTEVPNYADVPWAVYREDLRRWDDRLYIFPARPVEPTFRTVRQTFNTMEESYRLLRVRNSQMPDWGQAEVIAPESQFVTYVLSTDAIPWRIRLIRLGKWWAACRVILESALDTPEIRTARNVWIRAEPDRGRSRPVYLALEDLNVQPYRVLGMVRSLPNTVVWDVHFQASLEIWVCRFSDERVTLPGLSAVRFAWKVQS